MRARSRVLKGDEALFAALDGERRAAHLLPASALAEACGRAPLVIRASDRALSILLERESLQANGFYDVMAVSIVLGLNLAHVDSIRALFWSAVVNGVAASPIMVAMMLTASNPRVTGGFTIETRHKAAGRLFTAVMIGSAVAIRS